MSESSELALGERLEALGGLGLRFLSVWESSLVEGSPLTAKVFNVVDGEDNLRKLFQFQRKLLTGLVAVVLDTVLFVLNLLGYTMKHCNFVLE